MRPSVPGVPRPAFLTSLAGVPVAGIIESAKTAKDQVKQFAVWAPTAYAKKTKLHMGCLQ